MDEAPPLPLVPIGVDSETALILPGNLAPALVCVSTAERAANDFQTNLYLRDDGLSFYHRVLEDSSRLLVIHNASFDLAVACNEDAALVPKVFDAYAEGRVCCTITLQKVIDVALGMRKFRRYGEPQRVAKTTYFLADLILLYCDEQVAKADPWRKSYALLQGVQLSEWPPSAKRCASRTRSAGISPIRFRSSKQRGRSISWACGACGRRRRRSRNSSRTAAWRSTRCTAISMAPAFSSRGIVVEGSACIGRTSLGRFVRLAVVVGAG